MNKDINIEELLFSFLKDCLLYALKKYWYLLVVCPAVTLSVSHYKIKQLPKRFAVHGVVKMGYLKIRSFKSNILEKESEGSELEPYEKAMGLSKNDLQIVMQSKFINHRGRKKNMWDKGPFVTKINFPEKSNLIEIEVESEDRDKGVKLVDEIISFLEVSFGRNRIKFERVMKDRIKVLKKDHKRILKSLREVKKVEEEFGYTPILAKQKKDLSILESKIRYMLIDVTDQLDPVNIQDFEIISRNKGVYPVTKRKVWFYGGAFFLGLAVYAVWILFLSLLRLRDLPPAIPKEILNGGAVCS